jgi:hypothetical protein
MMKSFSFLTEISEADASLSLATPRLDHADSWDSEEESDGLGLKVCVCSKLLKLDLKLMKRISINANG